MTSECDITRGELRHRIDSFYNQRLNQVMGAGIGIVIPVRLDYSSLASCLNG